MSEAGSTSVQSSASAAASVRGPSSWEHSVRKHCGVLTIPPDLRETEGMLLKLKKFVNAVCVPTTELARAKIPPEQQIVAEDFGDGESCPRTRLRSQRGMIDSRRFEAEKLVREALIPPASTAWEEGFPIREVSVAWASLFFLLSG